MDYQDDPYAALGARHDDPQDADPYASLGRKVEPKRKRDRRTSDPARSVTPSLPASGAPPVGQPNALLGLGPTGQAYDGDTYRTEGGPNARLFGVDAFERDQPGYSVSGESYPLGLNSRNALLPLVKPGGNAQSVAGQTTYGRPVVTLNANGVDAGREVVRQGYAVPEPRYLEADPKRRDDYVAAQRDAIANQRGAYAGQYQNPRDYRQQGQDAPRQGRTPMTPEDAQEYASLVRDPATTPEKLTAWLSQRGQSAENIANILSLMRRNSGAKPATEYQQRDVTGAPVAPGGVGGFERFMAAVNEGIPDALGAPVDLVQMGLTPIENALGITPPEKPIGGSAMLRDWLHATGQGQLDERYAPQSDTERYVQAFGRGTGGAVVPGLGSIGAGSRLATRAPSALTAASAGRSAVRQSLVDAAKAPGMTAALETGASVGANMGGQLADDIDPTNPYLSLTAQVIGGLGGGFAGAAATRPRVPRTGAAAPERLPEGYYADESGEAGLHANVTDDRPRPTVEALGDDASIVQRDGRHFARALDGSEVEIPIDPSGFASVTMGENGWEALVGIQDGAPTYGPQDNLSNAIETPYRDLTRRLNSGRRPMGPADAASPPAPAPRAAEPQPSPSPAPAAAPSKAPLTANMPALNEADGLGPKSLLGFVPPKGEPGVSIIADDGHTATAVFRDANGAPRGAAQIPISDEAKGIYETASVYVDPDFRRQGVASQLYEALRREGYPIDQASGSGDLTPDGAAFVNSQRTKAPAAGSDRMAMQADMPELVKYAEVGPEAAADVRATLDRVGEGYSYEEALFDIRQKHGKGQRPRPLLADPTEAERGLALGRVEPSDLLPIPATRVSGVDEAAGIEAGRFDKVKAPDERAELASRGVPSPRDGTKTVRTRGPLDLVTWLRTQGGLRPQSGELRHYGIDNNPRKGMDFAQNEHRLGKLVDPDNGMGYDEAAERAWEAGFFPDHTDRPTISEFLDALSETHRGGSGRVFHPDDLEEVDRFQSARSQRYAVESAEDQGAPLAVDRSQPVTLEDLEKNAAPVHAYEEWGENAPDFAGNIRLEGLDSPQSIKRALVRVDQVNGGFDAARRGRITKAETEALAADLGMTPADLLKRRKGQALNAEQALAARQILAKSGNELVNLSKWVSAKIANGDATDAQMVHFREALVRHAAIQEQVAGATAEAGRVLSQFRFLADSRAVKGEVLRSLIDGSGGPDGIEAAAKAIIDNAGDPKRLSQVVKAAAVPGKKDKLIELYYNFLLSGPRTHAVNITSNLLTSMAQAPEHLVAAAIGAPRAAIKGADVDRVMFTEVPARIVGLLQGTQEGLRQFAKTMKTGEPSDLASKVEAQTMKAVSGVKGSILRTPTRLLMAEDELFKAMARRQEVVGLAIREARKSGLRGAEARKRAGELAANPTPEMLEQAAEYGRYLTFQRKLGPGGQAISNLTNRLPALKLFVPFTRTPLNLLKFAVERSPGAPLLKEWRDDYRAGGAKRDLALARASVGTGAAMLAVEAARAGLITGGGPADEKAKKLLQADGWQPYSVKVGDKWYAYQRLDPFSTTIGMAADYVDQQRYMTDKQREEKAQILIGSAVSNLSSKTWLSGMTNLSEAVSDPGRYGENLAASLAASGVPAILGQTATALDPVARDTKSDTFAGTVVNRIQSRLPFASKGLPARRDVLGNEIVTGNGGGVAAFSPVYVGERKNDPLATALLDAGLSIGEPQRSITGPDGGKDKVKLTGEQYEFYREVSSSIATPQLNDLVKSPDWAKMTPEDRQREVTSIVTDARTQAREMVLMQIQPKKAPAPLPPALQGMPDPYAVYGERR